jgi:hypothetical protein
MTVPTDVHWKAPVGEMTTFQLRQFDPAVHEAIRERLKTGSISSLGVALLRNKTADTFVRRDRIH